MTCIISAPSSSSGKTLLSLVLASWVQSQKKSIQTFKVGPDYLDPQQLSLITKRPCRNLDVVLSGSEWVKNNFQKFTQSAELALIEGAMGLFDGVGSSEDGSTADIARLLKLPIVLIVNSRGQAASLGALVKGFIEQDKQLKIAGVVLNNVNSTRHEVLLREVLERINVNILGCLPTSPYLHLKSKNLGLAPAHEIQSIEEKMNQWTDVASRYLNLEHFEKLLRTNSPVIVANKTLLFAQKKPRKEKSIPIAIAQDKAFHFCYPDLEESLESLGIEVIQWRITKDEPIPEEVKGIIIPGGFPELHAEEISQSQKSLNSIRRFFGTRPIYAECGGMLILGNSIQDENNKTHLMAGILPFSAKQGALEVGYRKLKSTKNSLLLGSNQSLTGHEFHRWSLHKINEPNISANNNIKALGEKLSPPWQSKGWYSNYKDEGWSNNIFHASWVHLHWPSTETVLTSWLNAVKAVK
ncbi:MULTISPECIES: cobyrinate a,c-diamide synthase [Prochlorococcus]|uniref:cobyrinate a,c-diamide synthase n=1 Tax=Prochlorococcus TaxID=1218 RepID=UPI0005337F1E|nr:MULTISPECIES: cobyrinate a,c-diamide synthase [Prochlorococcus]KGG12231.1 Cobyrinic acid A [Prochlorococcus sp. MIT 0601]